MSYTKYNNDWKDSPDATTPITQAALDHIETGIFDAAAVADAATATAAAALPKPGYGTSLPGSPVDGQEYILVDSITAPTYMWRFRYNAGSSSSYKWEFVGGVPAYNRNDTSADTSSVTAVDLSPVGPTLTLPRDGEYRAWFFMQAKNTGIQLCIAQLNINGSLDANTVLAVDLPSANKYLTTGRRIPITVTGTRVVKLQYFVDGGTGTFLRRELEITPIRVS